MPKLVHVCLSYDLSITLVPKLLHSVPKLIGSLYS